MKLTNVLLGIIVILLGIISIFAYDSMEKIDSLYKEFYRNGISISSSNEDMSSRLEPAGGIIPTPGETHNTGSRPSDSL